MQHVMVLIAASGGAELDRALVDAVASELRSGGATVGAPEWLAPLIAADLPFEGDPAVAVGQVNRLVEGWSVDVAVVPAAGRRKRLLISDMDSTMLENETLDELAEEAGVGAAVQAITNRSMLGEIDFAGALVERVAMLGGLPVEALDRTMARMRLMPGATTLVRTMRAHGAFTALVSGGFRQFTGRAAEWIGFETEDANVLEVVDGRLTGRLVGPILDRRAKRQRMETYAALRDLPLTDCVAVGDGANDLEMIAAAGLGVAFRAKPVVATSAKVRIDHADLTALLYLQGYRQADFVTK